MVMTTLSDIKQRLLFYPEGFWQKFPLTKARKTTPSIIIFIVKSSLSLFSFSFSNGNWRQKSCWWCLRHNHIILEANVIIIPSLPHQLSSSLYIFSMCVAENRKNKGFFSSFFAEWVNEWVNEGHKYSRQKRDF